MEQQAKALVLSILLSIVTPVYATDCPQDVQTINQGDKANCSGFLFSGSAEKAAESYRTDATYYKSLSDALQKKSNIQTDENSVLEKRLKLYMDSTQSLSQDLAKHDSSETLYRALYFSIGVLVTGFIAVNVKR